MRRLSVHTNVFFRHYRVTLAITPQLLAILNKLQYDNKYSIVLYQILVKVSINKNVIKASRQMAASMTWKKAVCCNYCCRP